MAEFQLSEEFELDLTGDGIPEQVLVSVHGDDPRGLEIELTVFGPDERILHGSAWSSAQYPELQRAGNEDAPAWLASQWVRERLQDLLADDALRPLSEEEIEAEAVRRVLRFEEWRGERGLPASTPLSPQEEAEVARIQLSEERVDAFIDSLLGRPALGYLAGDSFRTIVWSPELDRFVTVDSCC